MSTFKRFGVALFYTLGLAVGAIFYQRVFVSELLPLIEDGGTFSQPVFIMNRIVPIVLLVILLAVWIWVVAGAVQDETTVERRRIRR
jgi:hypothetical protein